MLDRRQRPSFRVCQRIVIGPPEIRVPAVASSTAMLATRRSGSGGKVMFTGVADTATLFASLLSGWHAKASAWTIR